MKQMPPWIEQELDGILARANACQEWLKIYATQLPPRIVMFFSGLLLTVAKYFLVVFNNLVMAGFR